MKPSRLMLILGVTLVSFGAWFPHNTGTFNPSHRVLTATVEEVTPAAVENRLPQSSRLMLRYIFEGATYRKSVNAVDKHWQGLKPGDTVDIVLSTETPDKFIAQAAIRDLPAIQRLQYAFIGIGVILIALSFFLRRAA